MVLKGYTYYNLGIKDIHEDLYARLTHQRLVSKPAIGQLRYLMSRIGPSIENTSEIGFELPSKKPKPVMGEVRGVQIDAPEKTSNNTTSCENLCKNCGNWFRSKSAQFGDAETFKRAVIYSNKETCPYCKIMIRFDKKDMRFVERDENGKIVNDVRVKSHL